MLNLPIAPFGEIQVTGKDLLIYVNFHYNINTEIVKTDVVGSGTVTQSGSTAILSTGIDADGNAHLESRQPARYLPGQGMLIIFSAKFGTNGTSIQEAGYGHNDDGLFFTYQNGTINTLRRSSVTGSPVDELTPLTEWSLKQNIPELDSHKFNVYGISFQWLGAGEITYWIENRHTGVLEPVHKIRYANANEKMSLKNPSLHLHASAENTESGQDTSLSIGNMAAYAFGKKELVGPRQAHRAELAYTTGAERLVLAIENKLDVFGGTANNRSAINATHLSWSTDGTKSGVFRVYRCTISGGTSADKDTNTSLAKYYTGAPTLSNQKLLLSLEAAKDDKDLVLLPDDTLLAPGETIAVTFQSAANSAISTSLSWKDLL
jgi:hypothetical protein